MINPVLKTTALTFLALTAFAANSVLCRLALKAELIDAVSFTSLRLLSGTFVLFLIIMSSKRSDVVRSKGSWKASIALFIYMIAFSYAYISLDTGTGALIVAGTVQITMIVLSIYAGSRLHFTEWSGLFIASSGFVYLVMPGASSPSLLGFMTMSIAGIAWGIYTMEGRQSKNPLQDTSYNFLRTMPLVFLLIGLSYQDAHFTTEGVVLALIAGGITSGLGYTIWYIALGGLTATTAAVLQLSIAAIAALGGLIFVSDAITFRLLSSASMVLGGALVVMFGKHYYMRSRGSN